MDVIVCVRSSIRLNVKLTNSVLIVNEVYTNIRSKSQSNNWDGVSFILE